VPFLARTKKPLRRWGSRFGELLDGFSAPAPPITFGDELAGQLRADWHRLLHIVGQRRSRDFSQFALEQ
jgi:hypothetical protein